MRVTTIVILMSISLISCGGEEETILPIVVPSQFSWGHVDTDSNGVFENYVTSIKSQNGPSCTLFAVVGALEIQYKIDNRIFSDVDLSEQSIENCLRADNFGFSDVFYFLQNFGIMEEKYRKLNQWINHCDYCDEKLNNDFGIDSVNDIPFFGFEEYEAILHPIIKTSREEKRKILMKNLLKGPVVSVASGWNGLKEYGGKIVCEKSAPSGHAFVVVGYEDNGNVFLVKNSHGDDKILKILYDDDEKCGLFREAYVLKRTWAMFGKGKEYCYSISDLDKDGIRDAYDNCPRDYNLDQSNKDGDLLGDVCDPCSYWVRENLNPFDITQNAFACMVWNCSLQNKFCNYVHRGDR